MKKLLILLCLSVALFGCSEKKVTEEMLIGDWECTMIGQSAKWKNGTFQNYEPLKDEKELIKYFIKDNVLYFNFGNPTSYPFDLASYYEKSAQLKSKDGVNSKTQRTIDYLSDDKFKTTELSEVTHDNNESDNMKWDIKMNCERVKK